jgi:hypothetical protein
MNSRGVQNDGQNSINLNQMVGSDESPAYVKFHSFQNPDSTWGFTIIVNSKPFRQYKMIPVNRSTSGFESQKDAELVANTFSKMIRNGNLSPRLNKRILDSLGITIKIRKMQEI